MKLSVICLAAALAVTLAAPALTGCKTTAGDVAGVPVSADTLVKAAHDGELAFQAGALALGPTNDKVVKAYDALKKARAAYDLWATVTGQPADPVLAGLRTASDNLMIPPPPPLGAAAGAAQ